MQILHTTTHYVNGLATGAAAAEAGLPWVYEVRGVLEETWAVGGSTSAERAARRASQRFDARCGPRRLRSRLPLM